MENISSYSLSCGNCFFTTLIILIFVNYYWSLVVLAAQKHPKCRCILRSFCVGQPVNAAQASHPTGGTNQEADLPTHPSLDSTEGSGPELPEVFALWVAIHRSSVPHHTPLNQPAHKVSVQLFQETGSVLWFGLGGICEAWWFTQISGSF